MSLMNKQTVIFTFLIWTGFGNCLLNAMDEKRQFISQEILATSTEGSAKQGQDKNAQFSMPSNAIIAVSFTPDQIKEIKKRIIALPSEQVQSIAQQYHMCGVKDLEQFCIQQLLNRLAWVDTWELYTSGNIDTTFIDQQIAAIRKTKIIVGHENPPYQVQWSYDGKYIASVSQKRIMISSTSTGKPAKWINLGDGSFGHSFTRFSWAPDGKRALYARHLGYHHSQVWLWNLDTNKVEKKLADSGAYPSWSSDGKNILYISPLSNRGVFFVDAHTGLLQKKILAKKHFQEPSGTGMWGGTPTVYTSVLSPDNKYIAKQEGRQVEVTDVDTDMLKTSFKLVGDGYFDQHKTTTAIAWSPDSMHIAVAMSDGTVNIYNIETKLKTTLDQQEGVLALAWSSDGLRVLSNKGMWDIVSGKLIRQFDVKNPVQAVDWSSDGTRIALAMKVGGVMIQSVLPEKCSTKDFLTWASGLKVMRSHHKTVHGKTIRYVPKSLVVQLITVAEQYPEAKTLHSAVAKLPTSTQRAIDVSTFWKGIESLVEKVAPVKVAKTATTSYMQPGTFDINKLGSFIIDYPSLTIEKKLGSGGFGIVYQGKWDGQDVAIKQLHMKNLSDKSEQEFCNETFIWSKLNHPNIVPLFGICVPRKMVHPYCMVMALKAKGSLYQYLHSKNPINWDQRKQLALDIISAIKHLHTKDILHRDLKSLNVLVDTQSSKLHAYLTDFGLSVVKNQTVTQSNDSFNQSAGTLLWMAPELLRGKKCTKATDIWAYGMILWELAARKRPFADAHASVISTLIKDGELPEIPGTTPSYFSTIIKQCLQKEPVGRPDAKSLVDLLSKDDDDQLSTLSTAKMVQTGNLVSTMSSLSTLPSATILKTSAGKRRKPPSRKKMNHNLIEMVIALVNKAYPEEVAQFDQDSLVYRNETLAQLNTFKTYSQLSAEHMRELKEIRQELEEALEDGDGA